MHVPPASLSRAQQQAVTNKYFNTFLVYFSLTNGEFGHIKPRFPNKMDLLKQVEQQQPKTLHRCQAHTHMNIQCLNHTSFSRPKYSSSDVILVHRPFHDSWHALVHLPELLEKAGRVPGPMH